MEPEDTPLLDETEQKSGSEKEETREHQEHGTLEAGEGRALRRGDQRVMYTGIQVT